MACQYSVSRANAPQSATLLNMKLRWFAVPLLWAIAAAPSSAQAPGLGQGWLEEFNVAASQLTALAEATPEDKFAWRPAPGIRSTGEVYMHVAVGNYWLLGQTGAREPVELAGLKGNPEKTVTGKAEILKWLKGSLDAVRSTYAKADLAKQVKFLGKDSTSGNVFLRILVHNHEHMGQAIAYARSTGVAPPWSKDPRAKE